MRRSGKRADGEAAETKQNRVKVICDHPGCHYQIVANARVADDEVIWTVNKPKEIDGLVTGFNLSHTCGASVLEKSARKSSTAYTNDISASISASMLCRSYRP